MVYVPALIQQSSQATKIERERVGRLLNITNPGIPFSYIKFKPSVPPFIYETNDMLSTPS